MKLLVQFPKNLAEESPNELPEQFSKGLLKERTEELLVVFLENSWYNWLSKFLTIRISGRIKKKIPKQLPKRHSLKVFEGTSTTSIRVPGETHREILSETSIENSDRIPVGSVTEKS